VRVLGIDPDLHNTAVAVADECDIIHVRTVSVDREVKSRDAVVKMVQALWCHLPLILQEFGPVSVICVEGQIIYDTKGRSKGTQNPKSILMLGQVAGAALGLAQSWAV